MTSLDSIAASRVASKARQSSWLCVLEEFRIWLDSRRQEGVPETMEEAVGMWQEGLR